MIFLLSRINKDWLEVRLRQREEAWIRERGGVQGRLWKVLETRAGKEGMQPLGRQACG